MCREVLTEGIAKMVNSQLGGAYVIMAIALALEVCFQFLFAYPFSCIFSLVNGYLPFQIVCDYNEQIDGR